MDATTVATDGRMPRARLIAAYAQEARCEVLRYLRNPGFLLPIILFPTVFYLMFGILLGGHDVAAHASTYLLASYSSFGVMAPGLFGFGVSLATERDNGLLTLKRALPMPAGAYLLGKMLMAMCVAAMVGALLLAMAVFIARVPLSGAQAASLLATDVLGVLPFCALGLLVGTLLKGQGAPGLLNMIYLPMAFLSGLWFPLQIMPRLLQQIAPLWPSYHLNALSMAAVGLSDAPRLPHALVLAGFTLGLLLLAARRLRRNG
ncbi:ABC transporter permease [Luteimonas sp. 50]|uniref:Transport permease protein n=1 Tax=Cognatiluteimonas sedimenti TaxID=2927791 RepID=A0ABT0A750_9GAMM|nr:ABC transporter permease [Lysobacter sedimenti]MCJ0826801.1 ABC transporter permease [Lysobacter sedimenti]